MTCLATLSRRLQVPYWTVLALSVPPLIGVLFLRDVVMLTVLLALVILFGSFVGSFALWNLPKRFPEVYEHSIYELPMWLLKTSAIVSGGFAALFWLGIVSTEPTIVLVIVAIILSGVVFYRVRSRQLAAQGFDLTVRLTQLHDHEAARSGTANAPVGADRARPTPLDDESADSEVSDGEVSGGDGAGGDHTSSAM